MFKRKSPEISEGLLFDLLSKRRAGKFTADELLWVVDHMELVRPLMPSQANLQTKNPNSSFRDLLFASRQDWVNSEFTEEHFPLLDDGTDDKEIVEYGFNRTVTGLDAEKELKQQGYKPIGIKRALEYVASHQNAQNDHPLIVLGAQWRHGRGVDVPDFFWSGGQRGLDLRWIDGHFIKHCRFLVVRE